MTRHPNDRMIDSFVYLSSDDMKIKAGVYVSGRYTFINGFWFYPRTAGEIHDYLVNPTGSSEMMGGTTL